MCGSCKNCSLGEPGYYHLHVSVEETDYNNFYTLCNSLGIEPVVISSKGKNYCMTNEKYAGTLEGAITKLSSISVALISAGYTPTRLKIELRFDNQVALPNQYYEAHYTTNNENVLYWAECNGYIIAKNIRKTDSGLVSIRTHSLTRYQELLEQLISTVPAGKLIQEFVILDTNPTLDADWTV